MTEKTGRYLSGIAMLIKQSDQSIADEAARLRAVLPHVPQINGFGEDNHQKIEAQVRVLEGRYDDRLCFDAFADEHPSVLESAQRAVDWLEGHGDSAWGLVLGKGWSSIAADSPVSRNPRLTMLLRLAR